MNRTRLALAGAFLALALIGTVTLSGSATAQSASPTTTVVSSRTIKIGIGDSSLGRVMVDGSGMTLYMFARDRYNVSFCDGQCLVAWPPMMLRSNQTLADVELSGGLRRSRLSYALRDDGSRQVTYNGWPLYYWFRDTKPGDVRGQWVNDIWWVMTEDGSPNTARVASAP